MIGSVLRRALNLKALLAHVSRARRSRTNVGVETELDLYSSIFQADFLHAGYFRRIPGSDEEISLRDVKDAMRAYAELAVERVAPGSSALDVGCGTGGLLALLREAGVVATGLTPNPAHREHIGKHYPGIPVILSPLEHMNTADYRHVFDAVVSTESFHNVPIDAGMRKVREVLGPEGKWIVIDYYRLRERTDNRSGHLLSAFEEALQRHGFRVLEEIDITENTLPSLAFAHCWTRRIGLPLVDYAVSRFSLRNPLLGYLFAEAIEKARSRVRLNALDPAVFRRDKRYLLHQLAH